MGKYNFKDDLIEGHEWEQKVANWLQSRGAEIIESNNTSSHDILYKKNGKLLQMEIKHDILSKSTGNVAIEFKSNGLPSGICTSKADYWCQIVEDKYLYIIDRPYLIYNILKGKYRVTSGGDNHKTYMYIIDIPTFGRMCKVHNLEGDEAQVDVH